MNRIAMVALVRNDLRLYRTDRRALIAGILLPILIAAFFGYLFRQSGAQEAGKIPVAVVDLDHSAVSGRIAGDFAGEKLLAVTSVDEATARAGVQRGKFQAALVIPAGFSERATRALFTGQDLAGIDLLVDPSQAMSASVVEGLLAGYVMQEVSREAFNGASGLKFIDEGLGALEKAAAAGSSVDRERRESLAEVLRSVRRFNEQQDKAQASGGAADGGLALRMPYVLNKSDVTAGTHTPYNSFAHSFAGMTVQFILFAGIDAGILLLLTRQRGVWQRIRAAPITRGEFVLARLLSTALISLFQVACVYLVARLVFNVRIEGSWLGFAAVVLSFALLNGAFGLMLATLGRSASTTRAVAIVVMLLLVMLGGAWVPSFVFPAWLQQAALVTPTRWAVDGLDAMTWRGLPLVDGLVPAAILLGCAALCLLVALWRFRWEE